MKVVLNNKGIRLVKEKMIQALVETADATKSDLVDSQTMPFDTGNLQNRSTFVDTKNKAQGKVSVVSDTPYARRLYYHPEYNFKTDKNPKAGGMWFEPYISGSKNKFIQNAFKRIARSKMK